MKASAGPRWRRAATLLIACAASASACSGDLLHSTSWKSRCEREPSAPICPLESASTPASASAGSSGGGGAGGAVDLGGAGGTGGTGGGSGGEGACATCSQAIGHPDPALVVCPSAQRALEALVICACTACAIVCPNGCPDVEGSECASCVQAAATRVCVEQLNACLSS